MPFSSTSFWRGLCVPIQKDLGDSLHPCAYSLPRWTRSSPQPRAGGRWVQLPGGAAFDSRSRRSRNYELLDPTRREGVRCAARLHARTQHLCLHARTPIPLSSLTIIRVWWLGVQAAFDKCHYRVRHFGMVFTSPCKFCAHSSVRILLLACKSVMCGC